MNITITGRNIELTQGIKDAVEEKLSKLDRYFTPGTVANVTISVEKGRHKIEVTIPNQGHVIRSEQISNDLYVSIDMVEETIEKQLKKYRTKLVDKIQSGSDFSSEFMDSDEGEDEDVAIVRTKRIGMKPMYPEDACIQMELTGHDFFVFRNAETDEINVVYRRKDHTYGMIEPEC